MAIQQKLETAVPPHEAAGSDDLRGVYEGAEFYDDVTGVLLDRELAIKARKVEIDFFRARGVYTKVRREPWMSVITTKWLDVNKGDSSNPNVRSRLVGREIAKEKRDDLFAATPPLESLKTVLSLCASHQCQKDPWRIMSVDVKRAYFYAAATRPLFIHIPAEDRDSEDAGMVAKLNLSLYGTRDAAQNWAATLTQFLNERGFITGRASPCNFHHPEKNMVLTVHGDDFTLGGSSASLSWMRKEFEKQWEVTANILGPEANQLDEIRVLNRVIRWTKDGLEYEPDQRHAEIAIRELGLEASKAVSTPGTKEELALAGAPECLPLSRGESAGWSHPLSRGVPAGWSHVTETAPGEPMRPADAIRYRGIAARFNFLAQDRVDLQYACKEASRRMAKPQVSDWAILKRIGRYLIGCPRYVQSMPWQAAPTRLDKFTDSDWAGCKATCRSTSGGVVQLGQHCIKSWSSTQATVALSSAEAELYALTKGAAQALGMLSLLADFGIEINGTVHTDASAAIGILRRKGLGKIRHLNVRFLWLQDQTRTGTNLAIAKVPGLNNPADIVTKYLNAEAAQRHLDRLHIIRSKGRAGTAPVLATLEQQDADYWDGNDAG